jgi:hypothetical protein
VWHGEVPDDGQEWLADLVFALPAVDRPSARLALLTAIAPHEVDEVAVDTFLRGGADQRALVELTAWASFTAARRVGAWLSAGVRSAERGSRVLPFRRRTPTATWSATDAATASGQVTLSP